MTQLSWVLCAVRVTLCVSGIVRAVHQRQAEPRVRNHLPKPLHSRVVAKAIARVTWERCACVVGARWRGARGGEVGDSDN